MTITKELKDLREWIRHKTFLLFQGEFFENLAWVIGGGEHPNIKPPYTYEDVELVWLREAKVAWDTGRYNENNLNLKGFYTYDPTDKIRITFNRLVSIRNKTWDEQFLITLFYKDYRSLPIFYEDYDKELKVLAELQDSQYKDLTQDFKDKCDEVWKKFRDTMGAGWGSETWSGLIEKTNTAKEAILKDPFFLSFKDRPEAEQKWMLKRMEYFYNDDKPSQNEGISNWIENFRTWIDRTGKGTYETAVGIWNIYQPKVFFLKMINWDGWTTAKQLSTANDKLKKWETIFWTDNSDTVKSWYDNMVKVWNRDIDPKFNFTTGISWDHLEEVGKELDKLKGWTNTFKDYKTPEQLQTEITRLTNNQKPVDYDKIKGDLKDWTDVFGTKTPAEVLIKYNEEKEKHSTEDLKPADLPNDWKDQLAEKNKWTIAFPKDVYPNGANDVVKTADENKEFWQQNGFGEFGNKINKDSLQKIKDKLDALKAQNANKGKADGIVVEKLKKAYSEKIYMDCERFYSDLGLGEDEADSKYKQPYENLLKTDKLNENTEVSNVINAFRIVMMITATDKCQGISDKMKKMRRLRPEFKQQKIDYFKKVKSFWKIATDDIKTTITDENNPLYLPIIDSYSTSQQQIDTIIAQWQQ